MGLGFARYHGPDLKEVKAAQRIADPRTEGPTFVQDIWITAAQNRVHPWISDDTQLLQLGMVGVAAAEDITAEVLIEQPNAKRDHALCQFARDLSVDAHQRLGEARQLTPPTNTKTAASLRQRFADA